MIYTDICPVIFRKWKTGGVIALFPATAYNTDPTLCMSYEHVGQHGAADDRGIIAMTIPASPEEYGDLKAELESIGYNLKIYQRETPALFEARMAQIREWNS